MAAPWLLCCLRNTEIQSCPPLCMAAFFRAPTGFHQYPPGPFRVKYETFPWLRLCAKLRIAQSLLIKKLSFSLIRMNTGRIGGRGSRGNLVEDEGFRFGDEDDLKDILDVDDDV